MPNITGTPGNDTLEGTPDADLIEGLGGDDTLLGRGGNDTTDGGPGNDVHVVEDAGDIVIEDAGEGDDIVVARVSYALGAGVHVQSMTTISDSGRARPKALRHRFGGHRSRRSDHLRSDERQSVLRCRRERRRSRGPLRCAYQPAAAQRRGFRGNLTRPPI